MSRANIPLPLRFFQTAPAGAPAAIPAGTGALAAAISAGTGASAAAIPADAGAWAGAS